MQYVKDNQAILYVLYTCDENYQHKIREFVDAVTYHELQFLSLDQIVLNLETGKIEEY